MKSQSILVLVAVLLFGSVPSAFATTVSFQGLGDLSGGSFWSRANGVSADGSTVVGESQSASSGFKAFRWTSASGMVGLGLSASYARGVSADGSTVVGEKWSSSFFGYNSEAFRWPSGSGIVGLGNLSGGSFDSFANGVSADGSTVVGSSKFASGCEAFRWTDLNGNGLVDPDEKLDNHPEFGLGDLSGGIFYSVALSVSGDGSTVVGFGNSTSGTEAFRWTSASGVVGLGDLAGGSFSSWAEDVSADGSTIVGRGRSALGDEAFRWTSASGMVGLGDLPGGSFASFAHGVSADGSTIVGSSESASGGEAFMWDTANGIKSLRDVLINDYGLDLTGWTLSSTRGISDDGLTIAGYGINPDGYTEAWIATIPEPASAVLLGLGAVCLVLRHKRR